MEPIYDRAGEPIAWRHRDAIFNNRGKPLALVRARIVYAPDGRFLGRFGDGFYRDASGYAVAFEEGATGGPLPPLVHPTGAQPRWEELPREPQLASARFAAHASPSVVAALVGRLHQRRGSACRLLTTFIPNQTTAEAIYGCYPS